MYYSKDMQIAVLKLSETFAAARADCIPAYRAISLSIFVPLNFAKARSNSQATSRETSAKFHGEIKAQFHPLIIVERYISATLCITEINTPFHFPCTMAAACLTVSPFYRALLYRVASHGLQS